jgi:sulfur-oxidizing protein SoxX
MSANGREARSVERGPARSGISCRTLRNVSAVAIALVGLAQPGARAAVETASIAPLVVVDGGIAEPLSGTEGSVDRGRALIIARDGANCVLCHAVDDSAVSFSGDIGPSLAGVGRRLTAAQIRLRVADNQRLNPATIMPSYHRVEDLRRVAPAYRGKPILTAQEVEDIVAYLVTLR